MYGAYGTINKEFSNSYAFFLKSQVFMIFARDDLIGYFGIDINNFLFIYIVKEYRGLGLGTLALNHLKLNCRLQGFKSLKLFVYNFNKNAIKLYKKLGFKLIKQNKTYSTYEIKI